MKIFGNFMIIYPNMQLGFKWITVKISLLQKCACKNIPRYTQVYSNKYCSSKPNSLSYLNFMNSGSIKLQCLPYSELWSSKYNDKNLYISMCINIIKICHKVLYIKYFDSWRWKTGECKSYFDIQTQLEVKTK